MADVFKELQQELQAGNTEKLKELIRKALDQNTPPMEIIEKGLRPAMEEVGKKFETLEIFLPEMLMAADTMAAGVELLRPRLAEKGGEHKIAAVVLGTVEGDVHRIGKDIVKIMLEGAGFEVTDAGHDVPTGTFIEKIREKHPRILGLSALMTTTMQNIPRVLETLRDEGLRDTVKVIVGGAPVLPDWVSEIGADGYGKNAVQAVSVSKELAGLSERRRT